MKLIALCLCIMLTACAAVQAQQPAASTPTPAVAQPTPPPAAPPPADTITLNLPKWQGLYAYQIDGVIIVLSVKDPVNFPIPKKFVFKHKGGAEIDVPLLEPKQTTPTEKK